MSSRRIILNTSATYIRSVIAVGLALFSSRWVLNALGQGDFGLFAVVGTLIAFVTFINNILAGSAGRYFAFAIGQGDPDDLNRWFNAAFSVHLCLALALSLLGWPVGEYCIRHILTIPSERIPACLWVFRISLVTAFTGMITVPCVAMFNAQQRMFELAFWGLLQTFGIFTLAWDLTRFTGDRLLFYAAGMAGINCLILLIQFYRAIRIFSSCRIRMAYWFDYKRLSNIFGFAMWNAIGSLGAIFRNEGCAILLNLYHGPVVNAAFGVANQVSAQTLQLSSSMLGAMYPEITLREGKGDRPRMLSLAIRACRFSVLLTGLFVIPLFFEMDFVLKVWLRNPPAYAAIMCRLMLVMMLIDQTSVGFMMAVNARGRIAAYQLTLGSMLALTLPLAWLFLKFGFPPSSVVVAAVITMVGCSFGRVLWMRHLFNVPVWDWLNQVLVPCSIALGIAAFLAWGLIGLLSPSLMRLAYVIAVDLSAIPVIGWWFVLDATERQFFDDSLRRLYFRFFPPISSGSCR